MAGTRPAMTMGLSVSASFSARKTLQPLQGTVSEPDRLQRVQCLR